MLNKKVFIVLLFSSIALSQSNSNLDYFPLKDNTVKKYLMGTDKTFPVIESITEKNNQFAIEKKFKMGDVNINTQTIYEVRESGIYEVASGGGMLSNEIVEHNLPYLFIKYPVKLKSSWNYTDDAGRKIKREIIALLSDCDVKGKHYKDVLKINNIIEGNETVEFYARAIGLIKVETEDGMLLKYLVE